MGQQPAASPAPASATKSQTATPKTSASNDAEIIEKIKEEGSKRSQVMETLEYLTEVIGPRLTNSPGMKRANEWTKSKMAGWGMENAHLEAWGTFGRGWTLKKFSLQVVEPQCIPLVAFPYAWSPGTDGPVTGEVVVVEARTEKDLEKYKGKLKGAFVLTSPTQRSLKAWTDPPGKRYTDTQLLDMANAPAPRPRVFPGMGGPAGGRSRQEEGKAQAKGDGKAEQPPARKQQQMSPEFRSLMEFQGRRNQFLIDEGVAAVLDPSRNGDGGTLFLESARVARAPGAPLEKRASAWDKDAPKMLPQIVVANEHYNRLLRLLKHGEKVKATLDLAVEYNDDDLKGYNTVAEIPGTDLKDEVVMLGGHMDSWHSGTGATDNGSGVAVAMEAARIIKALGLKPRRTIRVALWSGEEQGLLGSRGYVAEHFGSRAGGDSLAAMFGGGGGELTTKPEYEKFSAYYNLDNGTGKIRGIYLQGNENVRSLFRDWLAPFRDMGAATITASNTGGTDHQSFDAIGLPGFQFIQDPVEYDTRTHHSNMDVFDRVQADDLKQAAVIMAAFVYKTAMLDEKLPRKPQPTPSSTPPARPAAAGGQE